MQKAKMEEALTGDVPWTKGYHHDPGANGSRGRRGRSVGFLRLSARKQQDDQ